MDWTTLINTTNAIYKKTARETVSRIRDSWWVSLLPFLYTPLIFFSAMIFSRMGFAGGLLVGLVMALCTGSYLYFIDGTVHRQRISAADLLDSWRPHFGSVITMLFFIMIVRLLLTLVGHGAGAGMGHILLHLVLPVILSPIPEIIYQGRSEGFAMPQECIEFLRENSMEWFLPLVGIVVLLSSVTGLPPLGLAASLFFPFDTLAVPMQIGRTQFLAAPVGFWNTMPALLWALFTSVVVYLLMVFRGILFMELARGTRRQRIFRWRAAADQPHRDV